MTRSIALDLGSTRVKAGVLSEPGGLALAAEADAPPLHGTDPVREGDPEAYLDAAETLLRKVTAAHPDAPVGIACQRSTFLLWEAATGRPVTPLVSWQDRRADAWCAAHRGDEAAFSRATGLPLSAHYAGPKLAVLLGADPQLAAGLEDGRLRFGTLETALLSRLTKGRIHRTDLSMAARTLMVDLEAGDWSAPLLTRFGVPDAGLPEIGDSAGLSIDIGDGSFVTAMLADQGSAALATLGDAPGTALVNLGTGGFVLRLVDGPGVRPSGYLLGPVCRRGGATAWALEGTINRIGPAVADLGPGPSVVPAADPAPDALCVPDGAGIGAPHWRADRGPVFSAAADALPPEERRRVVLEGIVFRACEIVDDLSRAAPGPVERLLLGGGLAREPFVGPALAACSGRPVARLLEPEATLLGAARLAADLPPRPPATEPVAPAGGYLPEKYRRWRAWVGEVLP
jgi:glycerol kinase